MHYLIQKIYNGRTNKNARFYITIHQPSQNELFPLIQFICFSLV